MAIDVVHRQAQGQCLTLTECLTHGGAGQPTATPVPEIPALGAACPALLYLA